MKEAFSSTSLSKKAQEQGSREAGKELCFDKLPMSTIGRNAYDKSALRKCHGLALRQIFKVAMFGLPAAPAFFQRIDYHDEQELFSFVEEGQKADLNLV